MSFSSMTKDEICAQKLRGEPRRRSMLCALTLTAASLTIHGGKAMVEYVTENHNVGKLIASLATGLYRVDAELMVREHERLKARNTVVSLSGADVLTLLEQMSVFGAIAERERIPEAAVAGGELVEAFLRGIFLGAGSVSDPKKGYHLELVLRHEWFADEVAALLNSMDMNAKVTARKSSFVVYIKEGERIAEFLALIGAMAGVLAFENIRIKRGIKNNLNRQLNFEGANMQKTAESAAQQLRDITLINERLGLEALPQRLRETAELRINEPEASLGELSEILGVGKSGVNHRLKRLCAIAEDLRLDNK